MPRVIWKGLNITSLQCKKALPAHNMSVLFAFFVQNCKMKRSTLIQSILTCLTLFLLAGSPAAKAQVSQVLANSLQAKLDSLYVARGVEGISAAVYMPGRGTWKGAAGYSYGLVPIDTNMLFNIGSTTKTFVAAEILKLSEQGLIHLDDSIKDYLPAHVNIDSNITIRQMLNHTSGIGEILNSEWQDSVNTYPNTWWEPQPTIDTFLPAPAFQAGTSWSYCNTNYVLLGLIIEHLRHDSLTHVLRTDFLNPLALNETFMHLREHFTNPVPHNWSNPNMIVGQGYDASSFSQVAASTSSSAAGGLYASAGDLAHWGYNLYSGAVISQASLQQMTTFINIATYFNGYGLGCMRFSYAGKTYWGHAGNFFGMAASLFYYPQDGTTVAVLVNEDCISPYITREFFNSLLNMLMDVKDQAYTTHNLSLYPNPAVETVSLKFTSSQNSDATVRISSVTGKTVYTKQVKMNTGENKLDIPVTELSNGIYFCELQNADGKQTEKLVIQK